MSVMSSVEASFCRSAPWRGFARRVVLPWALRRRVPRPGCTRDRRWQRSNGPGATQPRARDPIHLGGHGPSDGGCGRSETRPVRPAGHRCRGRCHDSRFPDGSFDTVCSWLMLHHTIRWPEVLAEASRVLRPGGSFIGYDLTDFRMARLIDRVDRSEHRLIRPSELRGEFERQGFGQSRVEPALGGLVMRFEAMTAST